MNLTTALYLVSVLENANIVFGIAIGVVAVLFIVNALVFMESEGEFGGLYYNKWWIPALLALPLLLIPSTTTMYLMLGTSYLQEANLPSKVSKALELKLDGYIQELMKEKKDE